MLYFILSIVLVFLYFIAVYNSFISKKNQVKEAFATIDTQLKRRYELIPNLVNAVKGATKHEQETLEKVIKARNIAISSDINTREKAENNLSKTLKSIFALSENYPNLKANQNFLELQQELSDTENKLQAARSFYNTVVLDFNTRVSSFPSNIIAKIFNFKEEKFFELDDSIEKIAPKVNF